MSRQDGFCGFMARMLRRLYCIAEIHSESDDYYGQVSDDEDTRRDAISIDRSDTGISMETFMPSSPLLAKSKRLSNSDWILLEALDTRLKRSHHTGRFLTMHKRRRKRLITRSLTQDRALLDDIHHGQVKCVLDKVNQWPFNAFVLDNVTGGRSLPVLCVHLFHWYGLLEYFKLDVVKCWKFFSLIEEGYHSTNPYHNSIHATDVTQAMHCFLQEKKIKEHLTPLEVMASLIAAVTHDLDHPGVNQPFLIATSNHLAALYENSSVLENHHWRSAIGCLLESHVAEELEDCRPELQRQISSLILATDITRQQEFLLRFKRYLDQDLLDMKLEEHRHFILQIALKCADISNPCRPWEVSKTWSQKVCEEFFRQGDYERQLNLPVTALCDRQSTSVPKIQAGFFTFVVYPLFEEWHRFLGDGLSDLMMKNLHGNKLKWDALIVQENAEKTCAEGSEESAAEEQKEPQAGDSPSSTDSSKGSKRAHFLPAPESGARQKVGRRHSVPLSVPEPGPSSRTITRRESLALGENKSRVLFSSGLLVEEEEEEKDLTSSPSMMSISGGIEDTDEGDRKLSSENLLPELSITSITTVSEASRLSSVFSRGTNSPPRPGIKAQLTRQQTFPPFQTCFRQRYYSTTAEMARCTTAADLEQLMKRSPSEEGGEDSEASSCGTHCGTIHGCGTPPQSKAIILKQSNRPFFKHGDSEKQTSWKREIPGSSREKIKVAKILDEGLSESYEKENLDPRGFAKDQDYKNGNNKKNSTQGQLSKRRGSAPVGSEIINPVALALRGCSDRYPRRGSVPADAIKYNITEEGTNSQISLEFSLSPSHQHCPYQRRGSIPEEASCSGETSRPRSRISLRRRSSGGPEMFSFTENGNEKLIRKKEVISKRVASEGPVETATARRRGSLPIDVHRATRSSGNQEYIKDSPIKQCRSKSCNGRGETPLHRAAIKGNAELVHKLLEEGADPNVTDFAGWTPLHEASNFGWVAIASALIKAGACVNAIGYDDYTPLHDAAVNGHTELAQLLIDHGADVNSLTKSGETPGDLAAPDLKHHLLQPDKSGLIVNQSPRGELKLKIKRQFPGKEIIKANSYFYKKKFLFRMEDKNIKEDIYEFKSSKEATPVRGASPEADKNASDAKNEKAECHSHIQTPETEAPSMKRFLSDVDNDETEDETKKKKRKEGDGKARDDAGCSSKILTSAGRVTAARNSNSNSEKGGKVVSHSLCKNSAAASKAVAAGLGGGANSDRKSPGSPKNAAAPSQHGNNSPAPNAGGKTEGEQEEKSPGEGEKIDLGPKVPPLKIVIPQQTANEPEPGNRNGKNGTSRHHQALPYVVSSNSNDGEKEGLRSRSASPTDSFKSDEKKDPAIGMLSAEDQKGSLHYQRVLRSANRSGPGNNSETRGVESSTPRTGNGNGQNPSGGTSSASTSNSSNQNCGVATAANDDPSAQSQSRSSPSPLGESSMSSAVSSTPTLADGSSTPQNSSNYRSASVTPSKSNGASSSAGSSSNYDDKTSDNNLEAIPSTSQGITHPAPVELHPRKRKLKHNKEAKEVPVAQSANERGEPSAAQAEVHPHEQPVKNCYQLYLDIRKQIARRHKSLFPVQPKPPQGFKDYLMNRCTYIVAGNAASRQIPSSPAPHNVTAAMKDLFADQEYDRYKLRIQHIVEKEKLVLSVEQEILRVHGRAARALANQAQPFSACTFLKDQEVYNLITPEQEEKDRNARSRYNGRLFLSWLQDVDDKWEKIKEAMLLRHHNEAESLHAVQRMDWEWKLKDLGLCEFKSTPVIPENHVPMVHVSDDFDLLPA